MIVLRDELYFEPRCINEFGSLRWYGQVFQNDELLSHSEKTVYIRDNGSELFIYDLEQDELGNENKVKAVFTLICKLKKPNNKWIYGKRNK